MSMGYGEFMALKAMKQIAEWADAWVENETCIPETPKHSLTDEEKSALMLLWMLNQVKVPA